MKKLMLFIAALLPFCGVSAQEQTQTETGISFLEGTYAEALKAAKDAGRILFIDCYTQWCGPCKQMAKTTFKDAEVAEFFNESFINLKLDMETPDGIAQKNETGSKRLSDTGFRRPQNRRGHSQNRRLVQRQRIYETHRIGTLG